MNKFRVLVVALTCLFGTAMFVSAIGEETDVPGRLAIVGSDYNIYTYSFADGSQTALTDDSEFSRRYQWPTWSNDGRLAYFCCDLRVARESGSAAYVSPDGFAPGELVYEGESEAILYANWSPVACADDPECRDLALLINEIAEQTLSVEMVHNATETTSERIDIGSPFYYQWSSDGSQLVFHRNGSQIDIFTLASGDITENIEEQSSGLYQAPAWSPLDGRILFGVTGETDSRTDLVIYENGVGRVLVDDIEGFVSFLWSPDGTKVAYRVISSAGHGSVIVIDAETGERITSSSLDNIISFFWSPDSSKIAYISTINSDNRQAKADVYARPQLVQNNAAPLFLWSVLDVETRQNTQYSTFTPTYEMSYWLFYFDQFTPSHRNWSPDSRYLVYSHVVDSAVDPTPVVSLLDTTASPSDAISDVTEGVFAVWSFE